MVQGSGIESLGLPVSSIESRPLRVVPCVVSRFRVQGSCLAFRSFRFTAAQPGGFRCSQAAADAVLQPFRAPRPLLRDSECRA